MSNLTTKIFYDGIQFNKDENEIAFYSRLSKRFTIPFSASNTYRNDGHESYGCVSLPMEDIEFILRKIKAYIELEEEISKTIK